MSISNVIINLAKPIAAPTFDYDQMLYGLTQDLKNWAILVALCFALLIAIFVLVVILDKKRKMVTYKIQKDVKDEEGLYNLDTIDDYEDTRKKWELENREVQISYKIKQIDPEFSVRKFKIDVSSAFLKMQEYWTTYNLDKMRDLETDELYEQHKAIMEDYKKNNQKHIRENVKIEGCFLNSYIISKDREKIIVDYVVNMKDYIKNLNEEDTRKKHSTKTYFYRITFERTAGIKTKDNFEPGEIEKCPNCGAEVQVAVSEYCPFCNSLIKSEKYGWVISNVEKTLISKSYSKEKIEKSI